ncbi:alpha/beta hydrolase [Stenotrophomonas maltophilia]|nr:alpha/beta hydrolase [Stenotrophomonas maltophilia]
MDAGMGSDSYRHYAAGYYLSAELMRRCWQAYLGDLDQPPSLASPAHASNLQGLAPASMLSCEHDPLRDEAEQYAHRLQAAGVDCTLERLPGMIHACIHLQGVAVSTGVAVQRAGDLLRQALT